MGSGKRYLAADPTWGNPDADLSCRLCSEAAQTFKYAILSWASSALQRSRLLQGVLDLAPEAPVGSDQQLLIALAEFIRTTATGCPAGMPPLGPSLYNPPNPLLTLPPCPPLALEAG